LTSLFLLGTATTFTIAAPQIIFRFTQGPVAQKQILNVPILLSIPSAIYEGDPVSFSALLSSYDDPVTWTLEGSLPSGVSFNDGTFSGTPTSNGRFNFRLVVRSSSGTRVARDNFSMRVVEQLEAGANQSHSLQAGN